MAEEQTPQQDAAPEAAREPKVIKRYTNRKLYDTVESRYVTLDEIAEMIKAGADVKILDNRTKEDLTSVTLAQIIFEEEKKTSKMSLKTLLDLIRHGQERAAQLVGGGVEAAKQAAEQRIQTLLHKGQLTSDRAKELVATSQEAVTQFQRRIDERVKSAMEGMSSFADLQREIAELSRKISELERRLDEAEKK